MISTIRLSSNNQYKRRASSSQAFSMRVFALTGYLLLAIAMAACLCNAEEERLRVENRKQKDGGQDLAETINYLEGVDKYYSQLSRPRFGRSEYKQASSGWTDRLAKYRMAAAAAAAPESPLPIHWALAADSSNNAYQSNPIVATAQNGRYTPSTLADLIKHRLNEQATGLNYEQNF